MSADVPHVAWLLLHNIVSKAFSDRGVACEWSSHRDRVQQQYEDTTRAAASLIMGVKIAAEKYAHQGLQPGQGKTEALAGSRTACTLPVAYRGVELVSR